MAQAVSRRPLTPQAQAQCQVNLCKTCGGQSAAGTHFSPSTLGFPCHYHSTSAPYTPSTCCSYRKDKRAKPGNPPKKQCSYFHFFIRSGHESRWREGRHQDGHSVAARLRQKVKGLRNKYCLFISFKALTGPHIHAPRQNIFHYDVVHSKVELQAFFPRTSSIVWRNGGKVPQTKLAGLSI
jgi:hypothetical protein